MYNVLAYLSGPGEGCGQRGGRERREGQVPLSKYKSCDSLDGWNTFSKRNIDQHQNLRRAKRQQLLSNFHYAIPANDKEDLSWLMTRQCNATIIPQIYLLLVCGGPSSVGAPVQSNMLNMPWSGPGRECVKFGSLKLQTVDLYRVHTNRIWHLYSLVDAFLKSKSNI